jgi:hypothetical protein
VVAAVQEVGVVIPVGGRAAAMRWLQATIAALNAFVMQCVACVLFSGSFALEDVFPTYNNHGEFTFCQILCGSRNIFECLLYAKHFSERTKLSITDFSLKKGYILVTLVKTN